MNIALIPAKGHSRRVPDKNMADFCGKPLVQWSIEQALAGSLIDEVWVSTDSKDISQLARECNVSAIDRSAILAEDDTTQEQVIAHAIRTWQDSSRLVWDGSDNIVLLQPTSPLRLPDDIDNCVKVHGISVNSARDLYLWRPDEKTPVNFRQKSRGNFKHIMENGSIYVFSVKEFALTKSRYAEMPDFYYMQSWQRHEIDEPEDIIVCEALMRTFILKER